MNTYMYLTLIFAVKLIIKSEVVDRALNLHILFINYVTHTFMIVEIFGWIWAAKFENTLIY